MFDLQGKFRVTLCLFFLTFSCFNYSEEKISSPSLEQQSNEMCHFFYFKIVSLFDFMSLERGRHMHEDLRDIPFVWANILIRSWELLDAYQELEAVMMDRVGGAGNILAAQEQKCKQKFRNTFTEEEISYLYENLPQHKIAAESDWDEIEYFYQVEGMQDFLDEMVTLGKNNPYQRKLSKFIGSKKFNNYIEDQWDKILTNHGHPPETGGVVFKKIDDQSKMPDCPKSKRVPWSYCIGKITYPDGSYYKGPFLDGAFHGEGFFDFNDGSTYKGGFEHQFRNGMGTYTFSDEERYSGNWVSGSIDGYGSYFYEDGKIYEGEWKKDKWHGKGVLTFESGKSYEGNFVNSRYEGKGKLTLESGIIYEGEFKNDAPHGLGKSIEPDGSTYSGEWKRGKRHGKGNFQSKDGSVYSGLWAENKTSGKGVLTFSSGLKCTGNWTSNLSSKDIDCLSEDNKTSYKGGMSFGLRSGFGIFKENDCISEGNWVSDRIHGMGKLICDNSSYEGEFSFGARLKGVQRYQDGSSYEGEFDFDEQQGYGVMYYTNGSKYDGQWADGKAQGLGTFTTKNGTSYFGKWSSGKRYGEFEITKPDGSTKICKYFPNKEPVCD